MAYPMTNPADEEYRRGALTDAVAFLKSELRGDPVLTSEIQRKANAANISPKTLSRARAKLGVRAIRNRGPLGPWSLALPTLTDTRPVRETAKRSANGAGHNREAADVADGLCAIAGALHRIARAIELYASERSGISR